MDGGVVPEQEVAEQAVAKARKLVAMSASPHLEEARTSAFLACRLIRQHGLQITATVHRPAAPPPVMGSQPPSPDGQGFRRIRLRHPGRCLSCGSPISPGEWALWSRGNGLLHLLCQR